MGTRTRAPRSDGALNRERILDAARLALAVPDADVSMAEVARLSGVGSGTLYRHFATRHDLLEVLYLDEVSAICAAATAGTGEAGANLITWLQQFFDFAVSKRHVAVELLEHTDRSDPVFTDSRARVTAAGQPLLHRAQQTGQVTSLLDLDQILDMIVAIAKVPGSSTYVRPILNAALTGLLPRHGYSSISR